MPGCTSNVNSDVHILINTYGPPSTTNVIQYDKLDTKTSGIEIYENGECVQLQALTRMSKVGNVLLRWESWNLS